MINEDHIKCCMQYCERNNVLRHNCSIFHLCVAHSSVPLLLFLHSKLYRVFQIFYLLHLFVEYMRTVSGMNSIFINIGTKFDRKRRQFSRFI